MFVVLQQVPVCPLPTASGLRGPSSTRSGASCVPRSRCGHTRRSQPSSTASRPRQPTASADLHFARPFFLWMPRRMFAVKLRCVQAECEGRELTSAGLYRTVRQVLDVGGYFHMATEYLECGRCHAKHTGWSEVILRQLDAGHRAQFPAVLTYR